MSDNSCEFQYEKSKTLKKLSKVKREQEKREQEKSFCNEFINLLEICYLRHSEAIFDSIDKTKLDWDKVWFELSRSKKLDWNFVKKYPYLYCGARSF